LTFNQYLIVDDEPLLLHTGLRQLFPLVREAIDTVIQAERLRYISFSHYEADECGSLNEFLRIAPNAVPLCGKIAAIVSIGDVADRAPQAMDDGEVLSLTLIEPREPTQRRHSPVQPVAQTGRGLDRRPVP